MPRLLDNLPSLLKTLHNTPAGFITDIDGTISPSSPDPLNVRIPPENLRALSLLLPKLALVAVVSGRGADEVKRLVNILGVKCVGHYGLEWSDGAGFVTHPAAARYFPAMRALAADLAPLRQVNGIVFQDKGLTISLHYRRSLQPEKTKQLILDELQKSVHIKTLRIIEEKLVVGVVPPIDYDKGDAVAKLVNDYHLKSATFLGDDTADVPGFRTLRKVREKGGFEGLGILVTGPGTPAAIIPEADFTLDGVTETTQLLNWLVTHI